MASTPAAPVAIKSSPNIQPAFARIPQTDAFDCWAACVATLVSRPLVEIKAIANERFGLPKNGPYQFMDDELIAKLLAHWSLTATIWKESAGISSLPDVAIGLVEYNPQTEIGRHVVFVRQRNEAGKIVQEYIIDPAYWIDPSQHLRDAKGFPISWHIGVHQMKSAGK